MTVSPSSPWSAVGELGKSAQGKFAWENKFPELQKSVPTLIPVARAHILYVLVLGKFTGKIMVNFNYL